MAIGRPCEPFLLAEPDENDPLPSNDMEEPISIADTELTLLSPVTSRMGSFELLVHATYLLSKAIQCASECQQSIPIPDERYVQLLRTVEALMAVLEIEGQSAIVAIGMPRNILNWYVVISFLFSFQPVMEG
ncbi:hypothetical protein N7507_008977 [Penicillium longicatenatum]|nr:hypothetical protein N7507_008977 [Penicillium longicatenatum]